MKVENRKLYTLSPKKESELWEKAIFVFDSSALLDFYFYPEKTRKLIAKEIFEKLETRLWITCLLYTSDAADE